MKRAMMGMLATAVSLAACSDDGTAPTGDSLTRDEAFMLVNSLAAASVAAGVEAYDSSQSSASLSASSATRSAAEPQNVTIEHTSSHPCNSGRVTFEMDLEVAWDSEDPDHDFSYDVDGTLTPDACEFVEDDMTFTVDGDPSLAFEAHAASDDGELDPFTADAGGALSWSADDGRSGRCVIDIAAELDFAAQQRVIRGEVCGHTIDQTITWSGP